jgi:transposase-like protein
MLQLSTKAEENQSKEQSLVTDESRGGMDQPVDKHRATENRVKEAKTMSPDPEVPEQAKRRRFSAKYKLRILREADACTEKGQLGRLLRREGLYSSHITTWRRQREEGSLKGLAPKKRGRKSKKSPKSKRVAQLESENRRLRRKLEQAEAIIDIQKKVSTLLGISMNGPESGEND